MDRERKLLLLVAVLAPIFEVMTLFAWHQMSRDVTAAGAAHRETIACEAQLLRAWTACPGKRERRTKMGFGT